MLVKVSTKYFVSSLVMRSKGEKGVRLKCSRGREKGYIHPRATDSSDPLH